MGCRVAVNGAVAGALGAASSKNGAQGADEDHDLLEESSMVAALGAWSLLCNSVVEDSF